MANFNPNVFQNLNIPINNQIVIYTTPAYQNANPQPPGKVVVSSKNYTVVALDPSTISITNGPTINPQPVNFQTSFLDPNSTYFNTANNTWIASGPTWTKCLNNFTNNELCSIFSGGLQLGREAYADKNKQIITYPVRETPNTSFTHIRKLEWVNDTQADSVTIKDCDNKQTVYPLVAQNNPINTGTPVSVYYANVSSITNVNITIIGKADRYEEGKKVRTETYILNDRIPVNTISGYVISRTRQETDNSTITGIQPNGDKIFQGLSLASENQIFNSLDFPNLTKPAQKRVINDFTKKAKPSAVNNLYSSIYANLDSQAFLASNATVTQIIGQLQTQTSIEKHISSICSEFLEKGPWFNFAQVEPKHTVPNINLKNAVYTSATKGSQTQATSSSQNYKDRVINFNLATSSCSFWNYSIDSIVVTYDDVPLKTTITITADLSRLVNCPGKDPEIRYICYNDNQFSSAYEDTYLGAEPNYDGAVDTYLNSVKRDVLESASPDIISQVKRILTNPDFDDKEKRKYIIDIYRALIQLETSSYDSINSEDLDFRKKDRDDTNADPIIIESSFYKNTGIIFNADTRKRKNLIDHFNKVRDEYYAEGKWRYSSTENY